MSAYESRDLTLKSLALQAQNEIMTIRNMEKNYQNGKLHAFWILQFANAHLCLKQLSIK